MTSAPRPIAIALCLAASGCYTPTDTSDPSSISETPLTSADVVLYASKAPVRVGNWQVVADSTAASGARLANPDLGAAKIAAPLAAPTSYFEMTFNAQAGQRYHLWLRMKAQGDSYANDSVYAQFSDSVDSTNTAVNRIGTTSGLAVVLEDCSGLGVQGWGWNDDGWCGIGPDVTFATSGSHTIRIQQREDGASIDQIVLSPQTYLTSSPGALKNDSTILPESSGTSGTGATKLKFMTYNIQHGNGTDKLYNPSRQAKWIANQAPDIVCLNEVNGNTPTDLPAALQSDTPNLVWSKAKDSRSPANMILTPHTLVSSASIKYTSGLCVDAGALEATIDIGGTTVHAFCTHLDVLWSGCTGYSASQVEASRSAEVDQLKSWAATFGGFRIVAGDMNSQYDTPEMQKFASSTNGAYVNGWTKAYGLGVATSYSDNPPGLATRTRRSDLDHIFFTQSSSSIAVVGASIPDQRDLSQPALELIGTTDDKGVRPSDHNFKTLTLDL